MNGQAVGNAKQPADERGAPETQSLDFVTLAMCIIGRRPSISPLPFPSHELGCQHGTALP